MRDTSTTTAFKTTNFVNQESEWNEIRSRRDLLEVACYRKENPNAPEIKEIDNLYERLRNEEFQTMKRSPSRFSMQYVEALMDMGVFEMKDFTEAGLITPESMEKVNINVDFLPDISEFQTAQDALQIPAGTDVYFFGMPSSGKTAILTGIAAANGQGFTLDMRTNGGPYAAALRQYAQVGRTPGHTSGKFVTSVGGVINEESDNGTVHDYPVNLIEMSGEEFALRIAETKETSIANMGTGVTNLLRNDNHKVFFILVDASRPMVKVSYLDREIDGDEEGDISKYVHCRYISQLDILDKFLVLIGLPENQEIMNKVDAIHFIVTKSDSIGKGEEREQAAEELVETQYLSVLEQLKNYCRHTKRINRTNDYNPQIFTFSLGRFYLGDVYDYNSADTLKIVDAIRDASVSGKKYKWRKFVNSCRMLL